MLSTSPSFSSYQGKIESGQTGGGGVTDAGKAPRVPLRTPVMLEVIPYRISHIGDPKLGQGIMGHPPPQLEEGGKEADKEGNLVFLQQQQKKTFSWGVFNSHSLNCVTPECSISAPVQWDVGDPRWENGAVVRDAVPPPYPRHHVPPRSCWYLGGTRPPSAAATHDGTGATEGLGTGRAPTGPSLTSDTPHPWVFLVGWPGERGWVP